MRQDRSLTQTELAKRAKMRQSQISDIENPSFAGLTLKTLAKIAAAFDVAVIIRFVRFSDLARYALDDSPSKRSVTSFDSDSIAAPAPRPRTYFAQTATIVFDAHLVVDDGRGVTSIPPAHVIGANRTMKSYRAVN